MSSAPGWQHMILGNWDINWILALYSGQPQSIGCTKTTAAGMGCYPFVVGDVYANQTRPFLRRGGVRQSARCHPNQPNGLLASGRIFDSGNRPVVPQAGLIVL